MLKLAALLLLVVLGLIVGGAVNDAPGLFSYPVIVTSATFVLTSLAVVPQLLERSSGGGLSPASVLGRAGYGRTQILRVVAFCGVWIAYTLFLSALGFVLASSIAMVASLWITFGRFRPLASLSAVIFVIGLAVLVTTVLYVPVPKAHVDLWIDETIYTLMGR